MPSNFLLLFFFSSVPGPRAPKAPPKIKKNRQQNLAAQRRFFICNYIFAPPKERILPCERRNRKPTGQLVSYSSFTQNGRLESGSSAKLQHHHPCYKVSPGNPPPLSRKIVAALSNNYKHIQKTSFAEPSAARLLFRMGAQTLPRFFPETKLSAASLLFRMDTHRLPRFLLNEGLLTGP